MPLDDRDKSSLAVVPNFASAGNADRPGHAWRIVICVGLIALVVRLAFVASLAAPSNEMGLYDNAGDARQYISLARNLADFGTFIDDSGGGRPAGRTYYSLLRPPIYPALAAPFEAREWRAAFFFVQAFIGCAIPMFAAYLAWLWFHSRAGAWVAGLMAALSPTGIGLTGQVMADQLFATIFTFSLVAVAFAVRANGKRKTRWLWIAGLSCGMATLVKPAGLYWPFVLPLLVWLLARAAATRVPLRHVAVAVTIGLALPALWAARNYHVAGVFAVSTVDAQNLRYYLAPQAEEWEAADDVPLKGKLRRNRDRYMYRDEADFRRLKPAEIVKRQWTESLAIFKAFPASTMKAYTFNLFNHFRTAFNGFDYQFPNGGTTRMTMALLEAVTGARAAYIAMITLSVASLLPPFVPVAGNKGAWRSRLLVVGALVLAFLYVSGLSGTTYGTGSRILYPAHIAVQLLMAAGVANLVGLTAKRAEGATDVSPSVMR